jgi:hypothetical protein
MSSSQVTNSIIIQRGRLKPPTSKELQGILSNEASVCNRMGLPFVLNQQLRSYEPIPATWVLTRRKKLEEKREAADFVLSL